MVSIPSTNEPVQAQETQKQVPYSVYQHAQAQIHQLQQENRQLRQQLHWRNELDRVSGKIISQGHKGSHRATITHLKDTQPDEAGWYHLDIWRIAKLSGQSAGTVGKHVKYLSENVHLFDRREVRVLDASKPNGLRTEIYVKPHFDLIAQPGRYKVEKDREHGGDRKSCPHRGSERIRKKTTHTCMNCGLVIAEKVTDFNIDEEPFNQTIDNQDHIQEEGRVDSRIDDENQLDLAGATSDVVGADLDRSNFARQEINLMKRESKTIPDQVDLQTAKPPTPPDAQQVYSPVDDTAALLLDIAGDTSEHIIMNDNPLRDKKYLTVHTSLTLSDTRDHLAGTKTVGATLTHKDGATRALCFDADNEENWQTLQAAATQLAANGYNPILELSPAGRGGHLWIIFSDRVQALAAYAQVCAIAPMLKDCREYWPKGNGNKVRLLGGKYRNPAFSKWCYFSRRNRKEYFK